MYALLSVSSLGVMSIFHHVSSQPRWNISPNLKEKIQKSQSQNSLGSEFFPFQKKNSPWFDDKRRHIYIPKLGLEFNEKEKVLFKKNSCPRKKTSKPILHPRRISLKEYSIWTDGTIRGGLGSIGHPWSLTWHNPALQVRRRLLCLLPWLLLLPNPACIVPLRRKRMRTRVKGRALHALPNISCAREKTQRVDELVLPSLLGPKQKEGKKRGNEWVEKKKWDGFENKMVLGRVGRMGWTSFGLWGLKGKEKEWSGKKNGLGMRRDRKKNENGPGKERNFF